jgi:hypothetical protein
MEKAPQVQDIVPASPKSVTEVKQVITPVSEPELIPGVPHGLSVQEEEPLSGSMPSIIRHRKVRQAPDLHPAYSKLQDVYALPVSEVKKNRKLRDKIREFKKNYPWVFRIVVISGVMIILVLASTIFPPIAGVIPALSGLALF